MENVKIINYTNKSIKRVQDKNGVKGTIILYEVDEKSLYEISDLYNNTADESKPIAIALTKENSNGYDILCDNLNQGRMIEGGLDKETHKYILSYYIIDKGLDAFINQLM